MSMRRPSFRQVLLTCALATWGAVAPAATELVMVEEDGCIWCAKWKADIGPVYPKTAEGKLAPLRMLDIKAPIPDDLTFDGKFRFTPTFVLVDDGQEIGRIEGYPGEDFFWGLLGRLIEDLPEKPATDGETATQDADQDSVDG